MSAISHNLQVVRASILAAAQAAHLTHSVDLLAVSKTFDADAVIAAALAGQRAFGENYVQEAVQKITAVRATRPDLPLEWHFIGPIQSNKTRFIAENFDWVQSLASEKIARRLAEQRPSQLPPLNVCLQINIDGSDSKSGLAGNQALELARVIATLPNLRLRGLMAIPDACDDEQARHVPFHQMRQLFDQLFDQLSKELSKELSNSIIFDTLSMGMSGDMQAAIAEGATMVRIGSAIFGQRDYGNQT